MTQEQKHYIILTADEIVDRPYAMQVDEGYISNAGTAGLIRVDGEIYEVTLWGELAEEHEGGEVTIEGPFEMDEEEQGAYDILDIEFP